MVGLFLMDVAPELASQSIYCAVKPVAGTEISALPSKRIPLIVLAVANFVAVAAFPPMFKFATGVDELTTNGAVPVVAVDVNEPVRVRLVPFAEPILGFTKFAPLVKTTSPVPFTEVIPSAPVPPEVETIPLVDKLLKLVIF